MGRVARRTEKTINQEEEELNNDEQANTDALLLRMAADVAAGATKTSGYYRLLPQIIGAMQRERERERTKASKR